GSDLEHPSRCAFGYQRVAVRQPLRSADVGAEEVRRSVGPDQREAERVDLEHAGGRPLVDRIAERRDRARIAEPRGSAVVEQQQVTVTRQARWDQVRIVLADHLAERALLRRYGEV